MRSRPFSCKTLHARWWPRVHLFPCTVVRAAGFVPVIVVCGILTLAYITAVPATLVPLLSKSPGFATALLVVFHFIYVNVILNYAFLVLSDPGGVPDDWHVDNPNESMRCPESTSFEHAHLMKERTYEGKLRYCAKCKCFKPDRSHHCSVCRRCILKMDHHCVFIGNCVSFLNIKFFVSFITYACLGCAFVAVTAFPTMSKIVFEPIPSASKAKAQGVSMSPALESIAIIGWILCVTFAFALTFFVGFHAYLVTRGKTTIELYDSSDPERSARIAEYNVGAARNWRLVCGNVPLYWIFPVRAFIDGDGLAWPRKSYASSDNISAGLLMEEV